MRQVPVKAVVFDVGGVLETEQPMPEIVEQAFARVHDPDDLITTGVRSEQWIRRTLVESGMATAEVDVVMAAMWDWYCGTLDQDLFDWAIGLASRVRLAILSNSADGARREEESRYGFSRVFDPIVYSHEVGMAKPDPRIFRLTCDLLDIAPAEVVLIDNHRPNIDAAAEFGMRTVHHRTAEGTVRQVERMLGPRVQP